MICKILADFLQRQGVKYEVNQHQRKAYTALDVTKAIGMPADQFLKVVIMVVERQLVMLVVPASRAVKFSKIRKLFGAKSVRLAKEREFAGYLGGCEPGAMCPFGNLHQFKVYLDLSVVQLGKDADIYFRAGSHDQVVKLRLSAFVKLAKPIIPRESFTVACKAGRRQKKNWWRRLLGI